MRTNRVIQMFRVGRCKSKSHEAIAELKADSEGTDWLKTLDVDSSDQEVKNIITQFDRGDLDV